LGLHLEAKFPLTTGKHMDPRIHCRDCHKLELGSAGTTNTDCLSCHLDGPDKPGTHLLPEMDARHQTPDGGTVAGYDFFKQGASPTNFCLAAPCHSQGQPRP